MDCKCNCWSDWHFRSFSLYERDNVCTVQISYVFYFFIWEEIYHLVLAITLERAISQWCVLTMLLTCGCNVPGQNSSKMMKKEKDSSHFDFCRLLELIPTHLNNSCLTKNVQLMFMKSDVFLTTDCNKVFLGVQPH